MTPARVSVFVSVLFQFIVTGVYSTTFTFTNNCGYTVWPGLLASAGSPPLETTGFVLEKGETRTISAPPAWSGRFWGRTLCSQDTTTGKFTCVTADCGSGTIECAGGGAAPPATLAEFTLSGSGGFDFYDVSLVDGYNIQMLVVPQGASVGGGGNCNTTGCVVDLNGMCPSELRMMSTSSSGGVGEGGNNSNVACKSACEAFRKDEYCCSGEYGNPNTCKPSSYSEIFKSACPRAYSYAYDDGTSTFTCTSGADYLIAFCPPSSANSQKSSHYPEAAMIFGGGNQDASISSSTSKLQHGGLMGGTSGVLLAVAISILASFWHSLD